jgi:hypothetical protein
MSSNKIVGTPDLIKTFNWSLGNPQWTEPIATLYENGYSGGDKALASNVNFIYKEFGEKINHILKNGIPKWISTREYGTGDVVNHSSRVYQALSVNTNSEPYTSNLDWTYLGNKADLQAIIGSIDTANANIATNTSDIVALSTAVEALGNEATLPQGYINVPTPTYASARTITINGNACARSGDDAYDIRVNGSHTVSLDVVGIDGLASGSLLSNTWYYLYATSLSNGTGGGYLFDTAQGLSTHTLGASNRLLWSEDLTQSAWVKNGSPQATVMSSSQLSPLGDLLADTLVDSTDTASSGIQQDVTAGSTTSTLAVFLKRGNTDWVRLVFTQGSNQVRQWVNLATGALGTQDTSGTPPTGISTAIESWGSGWYRVRITATFATNALRMVLNTASANGSNTRVSGGTVHVFGADINDGGTADGYVKTEGSIVTGTTTFRSRQLPLAVRTNGSSNIFPFRLLNWNGRTSSLRYITDMFISEFGLGSTPTEIGAVSSGTYSAFSLASFVPPPSRIATLFAYSQGTGILYIRETGETLETRFYSGGTALVFNPTVPVSSAQSVDMRVGSSTFDVAVEGYTINL